MRQLRKKQLIIIGVVILLAGAIFISVSIYENALREREATMEVYLKLDYCKDTETLSDALNRLIINIENSQTLRAAEQTELLDMIASAARRLDMGLTRVDTSCGTQSVEITDTPQSMVNLAGIQFHLGILPEQTLQIAMSWRQNPEMLEDMERIQEYLDGVGSDDTPRGQFEAHINRRLPDNSGIRHQSIPVIDEAIKAVFTEGNN